MEDIANPTPIRPSKAWDTSGRNGNCESARTFRLVDGAKHSRFCCEELQQVDADGTLRCVNPSTLKAFFQWLIDTAKKPQQAPTLLQYFRLLKMIYRDATGCFLDPGVVSDVNAVSVAHECTDASSRLMRPLLVHLFPRGGEKGDQSTSEASDIWRRFRTVAPLHIHRGPHRISQRTASCPASVSDDRPRQWRPAAQLHHPDKPEAKAQSARLGTAERQGRPSGRRCRGHQASIRRYQVEAQPR